VKRGLRSTEYEIAPYCLQLAREAGVVSAAEAQRLAEWLEQLAASLNCRPCKCAVHNDLHPWNVLVGPDSYELTGIVDWSNAAWADPVHDFSGFPLRMIPVMVEGAREAGDLKDKNVEGRILWQWVSLALWEMAKLDLSAEDRAWWRWPVGGFDEVATFLRESPDKAWRKWAPA
jgi:hypothetical protein